VGVGVSVTTGLLLIVTVEGGVALKGGLGVEFGVALIVTV
jgi:hypothetical protein